MRNRCLCKRGALGGARTRCLYKLAVRTTAELVVGAVCDPVAAGAGRQTLTGAALELTVTTPVTPALTRRLDQLARLTLQ